MNKNIEKFCNEYNSYLIANDWTEADMQKLCLLEAKIKDILDNLSETDNPLLNKGYSFISKKIDDIIFNSSNVNETFETIYQLSELLDSAREHIEIKNDIPENLETEVVSLLGGFETDKFENDNYQQIQSIDEQEIESENDEQKSGKNKIELPQEIYEYQGIFRYLQNLEDLEFADDFINEAIELIEVAENSLLELESDPDNKECINKIFRVVHSLKGSSGFLNLKEISTLAHEGENLLDKCRSEVIEVNEEIISLLLNIIDTKKRLLNNFIKKVAILRGQEKHIDLPEVRIHTQIELIRKILAGQFNSDKSHKKQLSKKTIPEPSSKKNTISQPSPPVMMQSDSIRVPVKKIDDVSEMVGELLISLSLLNQNQNDDFHNIEMISEQLQKKVLSMRLFPIAGVYEKLKRQVRDISSKMNKQVNFITTGAQTEVDKNVVEEIFAPLTHIIRNSMDHGLEPLEIRKSKNKPEKGTIKLVTENRGDNVSIRIFDDGNGLNKEKILSKAIENKIIKPETVLSDNEIFNLIFQPGFSTADKVTDISGRGVGMDVVKKTVEKLDGKIFVSSETGKGSVFEIVLPLSASILDGLVVKLGNSKFIFPILKVKHTLTPELNNVKNIYENQGQFIVFENQTVPLICLGEFYKMEYKYKTPETAVILIVEYKNKYYGIMLDEILNKQKIVAKKVPEYFTETPGVKAGTILGDGSVGLILEPEEIVEKFINN